MLTYIIYIYTGKGAAGEKDILRAFCEGAAKVGVHPSMTPAAMASQPDPAKVRAI